MTTKTVTIRVQTEIEYTVAVNDSNNNDVRCAVCDFIRGLTACDNEHPTSVEFPMVIIKSRRVKFDTMILNVLSVGKK